MAVKVVFRYLQPPVRKKSYTVENTLDSLEVHYSFVLTRDGTTDTTRTVHFGTPTKKQKVSEVEILLIHFSITSRHNGNRLPQMN